MAGNGNLANLQNATAARTAAAQARAETALDSMITADEPVTFRSLATRAGVCLDFLYRNTQIRARVERHRAAQPSRPRTDDLDLPRPGQPGAVIRTLTAQLADLKRRHRDETAALRQALEAAHGENLLLRRRLGISGQADEEAPGGPPCDA
jgi:hypothetical protein